MHCTTQEALQGGSELWASKPDKVSTVLHGWLGDHKHGQKTATVLGALKQPTQAAGCTVVCNFSALVLCYPRRMLHC